MRVKRKREILVAIRKFIKESNIAGSLSGVSMYEIAYVELVKQGRIDPVNGAYKTIVTKYFDSTLKKTPNTKHKSKPMRRVVPKEFPSKALSNEFIASPQFLESYEWRRIRYEALKVNGAKCQCCGATPDSGAVMNVDHIKPRKYFPELALTLMNLQVLCHECNHGKANWDDTDWR